MVVRVDPHIVVVSVGEMTVTYRPALMPPLDKEAANTRVYIVVEHKAHYALVARERAKSMSSAERCG